MSMPAITASYRDICRLLGRRIGLPSLLGGLPMLGMEVEAVGDELRVDVPHNRPDLLGPEGVARVLKGILGIELGSPRYELRPSRVVVEVDVSTRAVRPSIAAGVVEGVRLTDESVAALMQIQDKLDIALGRRRRRSSIGVYDLDKVKPPIRYTTTLPDRPKFVPLDFDRELTPSQILREHPKGIDYGWIMRDWHRYPLLVDSAGQVLSMPPIINSEATRVTDRTRRLFIDVTGEDERVVDQNLVVLMTSLAERGFKLRSVAVRYPSRTVRTPTLTPTRCSMSVSKANELIGLSLSPKRAAELMRRMRYHVASVKGDVITLLAPPYRLDLLHEVDLAEDLAIAYGYDELKPTMPPIATIGERDPLESAAARARQVMIGLGFTEAMTFTLTNPRVNFELMRTTGEAAEIANPISEEYTILRTWLLPSLLGVLRVNKRNPLPQRVFEVGDVVLLDERFETGARNVKRVAGVVIGGEASLTSIKAVVEALFRECGVKHELRALEHPSFLEGRAVELVVGGGPVGFAGELHPEVILGFELEHPVAAFELELLEFHA